MQGRRKFWKYFRWFLYLQAFGIACQVVQLLFWSNFKISFWVYFSIGLVVYAVLFFTNTGLGNGSSDVDPNDDSKHFPSYSESLHWRAEEYWKDDH